MESLYLLQDWLRILVDVAGAVVRGSAEHLLANQDHDHE